MGTIAKIKKMVLTRILEEEDFILVVVHPVVPGVVLPEDLMNSSQPVGLHIGRRMKTPIVDLEISQQGIRGTLSFDATPFLCEIPWRSVIQLSTGEEHLLWMEPALQPPEDQEDKEIKTGADRSHLKLV